MLVKESTGRNSSAAIAPSRVFSPMSVRTFMPAVVNMPAPFALQGS